MRREWMGCLCLLTLLGAAVALAADDAGKDDGGPSLEYRPPKPILPEPKGPTPAPPVPIFRQSFGGFGIGRGSFDGPRDVAFGSDGRMFVLDDGNNRIQMFDAKDNYILEWGSEGSDERRGQFRDPSAIAVLPDSCRRIGADIVILIDTGNHRFQWFRVPCTGDPKQLPNLPVGHAGSVFEEYGSDFGDIGEYGISDGRFNRPLDIAFEEPRLDGVMIWVLDSGNDRVQRFELKFDARQRAFIFPAVYVDQIGNFTGDRGNLKGLTSIAWSNEGSISYLYLLGTGCTLQKFKVANLPLLDATWPAVAPESGLCVPERIRYDSEKEYVYVLDSGNSMLSIFHRSGNFISALQGADRRFDEPRGFDLMPGTGEFVLADTGNNLVQKFTLR